MSPMPPKRPAGTEGAFAAPAPQQAAQPDFGRAPVDFTDQASFAPEVDSSPYASAKSAKRAAKALGGRKPAANKKAAQPKQARAGAPAPQAARAAAPVAVPGTMDVRSQMHVVVGGTHVSPATTPRQAQRPGSSAPADAPAPRPAGNGSPAPAPRPAANVPGEAFPAEGPYIKAVTQHCAAAQDRPSAAGASVARPKPQPRPARTAEAGPAPQAAGEGQAGRETRAQAAPRPGREGRATPEDPRTRRSPQTARDPEALVRRASVALTCLVCVAATCLTLYTPAQQLYSAMRANERLSDELAQNQARVEALDKSVSALQTAEGVQDMAHKTWGLVMPDEVPISVENAPYTPADTPIPAEVKRGSGQNTSTWVTDVLDQVFGQAGSTTATESDEKVATLSEAAQDDAGDASQVTSALPTQDQAYQGE